jgi:superfamily II DNA or RNA helicase
MPTATAVKSKPRSKRRPTHRKVSRTHKPADLDLHDWQAALRRQFAHEQRMRIRNVGDDPVFSDFAVTNPASGKTYRVAVRGDARGLNYCTCPDYAVNTLGTCKHVEAVLKGLRRRHGRRLRAGHVPAFAEVYVRYGPQRTVVFSPGTSPSPRLVSLARRFFDKDGVLRDGAHLSFDDFLRNGARLGQEFRVYDDAAALIAEMRDDAHRADQLQRKYGRGGAKAWERLLKARLHPYQRDGALFAAKAGRAIVADEMGLGKTIQAIAAAEMLARECGIEQVLIVCPTSLKTQWAHEIEKFSRRSSRIIEGLTNQRAALYRRDDAFFKIVNYDVIHRDLPAIARWAPDLVILDEAQRIKNWETRTARSVKQLNSRYALVLTGTPLENRIEELHSIVEFVDRFRLGPLFAFKAAHELYEGDSPRVVGYRDLDKVSRTLGPILIRRTKQQVLSQLPRRMDKNFFVPMTDPQWTYHRENQEIVARLVHKWRTHHFLAEADQLRLRIALQYMRMSCDDTHLIDQQTRNGTKVDELAVLLDEVLEDPEAKAVIFSQWVRMNRLIADMLDRRGWRHVHLHGGVPSRKRKDLVAALHEDDGCRVFLSSDAGGVGLNLQRASTVINMDLPWNPAVLEQRIGRIHRLGQQRAVRVVNYVSEGTIEHGMLSLLAFKKSVFAGVLDGTADKVMMGDSAMNRFMKTVEKATASVPQAPAARPDAPRLDAGDETQPGPDDDTKPEPESPAEPSALLGVAELEDLISRGAEFLAALSRQLNHPAAGTDDAGGADSGPRIATNPQTGRRELRIALPDPDVLAPWLRRLSGLWTGEPRRQA